MTLNVDNLHYDEIDSQPQNIDWSEGYGETWEYTEAVICSDCDHPILDDDDHADTCPNDGNAAELGAEGPMMSYWYPLVSDVAKDATLIADLPLCLIHFEDGRQGLALTGGGMDLSWEIVEAYIRLGCYPPVHFCRLPAMAGKADTPDNLAIVTACERSLDAASKRITSTANALAVLRANLKNERFNG